MQNLLHVQNHIEICKVAFKFQSVIRESRAASSDAIVKDELVDILILLALFEQNVLTTGYGTLAH